MSRRTGNLARSPPFPPSKPMRFLSSTVGATVLLLSACQRSGAPADTAPRPAGVPAPAVLSAPEAALRDYVRAHHDEDVALLEKAVNISSGTQNTAGVRQVGDLFAQE